MMSYVKKRRSLKFPSAAALSFWWAQVGQSQDLLVAHSASKRGDRER